MGISNNTLKLSVDHVYTTRLPQASIYPFTDTCLASYFDLNTFKTTDLWIISKETLKIDN